MLPSVDPPNPLCYATAFMSTQRKLGVWKVKACSIILTPYQPLVDWSIKYVWMPVVSSDETPCLDVSHCPIHSFHTVFQIGYPPTYRNPVDVQGHRSVRPLSARHWI